MWTAIFHGDFGPDSKVLFDFVFKNVFFSLRQTFDVESNNIMDVHSFAIILNFLNNLQQLFFIIQIDHFMLFQMCG